MRVMESRNQTIEVIDEALDLTDWDAIVEALAGEGPEVVIYGNDSHPHFTMRQVMRPAIVADEEHPLWQARVSRYKARAYDWRGRGDPPEFRPFLVARGIPPNTHAPIQWQQWPETWPEDKRRVGPKAYWHDSEPNEQRLDESYIVFVYQPQPDHWEAGYLLAGADHCRKQVEAWGLQDPNIEALLKVPYAAPTGG